MAIQIFERYHIQAHGSAGSAPRWFSIGLVYLNGWWAWRDDPRRERSGHTGAHTYADSFAFRTQEDAEACLFDLRRFPQEYDLRILKSVHVVDEVVIGPVYTTIKGKMPDTSRGRMWPYPKDWTFPK